MTRADEPAPTPAGVRPVVTLRPQRSEDLPLLVGDSVFNAFGPGAPRTEPAAHDLEGVARGAQWREGAFHDLVTYAVLRSDEP